MNLRNLPAPSALRRGHELARVVHANDGLLPFTGFCVATAACERQREPLSKSTPGQVWQRTQAEMAANIGRTWQRTDRPTGDRPGCSKVSKRQTQIPSTVSDNSVEFVQRLRLSPIPRMRVLASYTKVWKRAMMVTHMIVAGIIASPLQVCLVFVALVSI